MIASLILAGLGFVFVLGGAVYGAGQLRATRATAADIKMWRRQALRALDEGDLDVSETLSRKVLRHRPSDARVRANLGRTYRRTSDEYGRVSDLYRAIAEHKLAIASRPDLPDLYYNVACYYALAGDTELAFEWLHEAIDRGFGRLELMKTDPDLATLRTDARFDLVAHGRALPVNEAQVEARLERERVPLGKAVGLEIVVRRMVPAAEADSQPVPRVTWSGDETLHEVDRQTTRDVELEEGWAKLTFTVRIEVVAQRDGLFAVPGAKVQIGEKTYETGALVLTVEPAA